VTCAVCTDEAAARLLWAEGVSLVLFGADAARLGHLAAALGSSGPGRVGRVAAFAGDPASAADLEAALAMAREQFGADGVVVASVAQARALVAGGRV
jgi:NADP-dependent 3-hydroxy acid dehydrogenase YdfG